MKRMKDADLGKRDEFRQGKEKEKSNAHPLSLDGKGEGKEGACKGVRGKEEGRCLHHRLKREKSCHRITAK